MIEHHSQLTNTEFENRFQNCELSPKLFSHEAHLRLAWIHINQYGAAKAIQNITNQIKNYVKHLDAEDKYNETLTVAAIKVVEHFMNKSQSDNFQDFIIEYPRLKNNFKTLIDAHYGFDIFNSKKAKQKYLEPDLLPFD